MASSRRPSVLLPAAVLLCAGCAPLPAGVPALETEERPAAECVIEPPQGPFAGALEPAPAAPTADVLPSNQGASIALITPDPVHRWMPTTGLVGSEDGSLRLRGIVRSPGAEPGALNVVVLVDYMAAPDARVVVRSADRADTAGTYTGSRIRHANTADTVAFDIELPAATVAEGSYQEVQTAVWLHRAALDVRRWTVYYSGPRAPAARPCALASEAAPLMPLRAQLAPGGRLTIAAPRAATLAVVPVTTTGPGAARFVRIDAAQRGWEDELGDDVELAAVWEGALTGPGTNWISSFWSARPSPGAADSGAAMRVAQARR